MSWQDQLGRFGEWMSDVTGYSDLHDEVTVARGDGDLSAGDWAKLSWKTVEMAPKTVLNLAFKEPFKTVMWAADEYQQEVVGPLGTSILAAAPWSYASFRDSGESYADYLRRVGKSTWGSSEPATRSWTCSG